MKDYMKKTIVLIIVIFLYTPVIYAENKPVYGGVLKISSVGEPTHLNPAIQSGILTGLPGTQIFASLLRIDRNWKYHPNLAKKWEFSKDELSLKIYLRENAFFHDGKPITSEDIVFSIETVKKYHPFKTMLSAVERVEAESALIATIYLKQPHPALLLSLASPMVPIIPKHIYGDGGDIKTHPANKKPIGSGPFRFVSWKARDEIVLQRFEKYFFPDKPYIDKIIIKHINSEALSIALETGAIDFMGFGVQNNLKLTPEELQKKLKIDDKAYAGIGPLIWLAFNTQKSPFNNKKVRKAISYAIDRKLIIETIFGNSAQIATGPICPGTPFYSDEVNMYDVDIEKANELLNEAGYPKKENGIRFTVKIDATPDHSGTSLRIAEYIRNDLLRKIGIEIEIVKERTFPQWVSHVANHEFEIAIDQVFNWGDPVIGVHRTYSSDNIRKGVIWSNTQGYKNADVDKLMKIAETEMHFKKRKALYHDFQKQVVDDLPVYWLVVVPYINIYNNELIGLDNTIWGSMIPYDEVYWSK